MSTIKAYNEIFNISPEFLKRYNFFLNKYASNHGTYSIYNLINDLRWKLGCLSVALLQLVNGDDTQPRIINFVGNKRLVRSVIVKTEIRDEISRLYSNEHFYGNTIRLEDFSYKNQQFPITVDIIPLPNVSTTKVESNISYLFVFIDPAFLKWSYHDSQRNFERALLAQFLSAWWARMSVPRITNNYSSHLGIPDETHIPDWLNSATISELLQEGIRSAPVLRRFIGNKEVFFATEISNESFIWSNWVPRSILSLPKDKDLLYLRNRAKSLTYWCVWIDSHRDLEKDQTIPIVRWRQKPGDQAAVSKWVQKQRYDHAAIDKQISTLRGLSATAFFKGTTGQDEIQPNIIAQEYLSINRKSLLCFALKNWLEHDGKLETNLQSGVFSDIEYCTMMHSVAVISHYLLGGQEISEEVIHRLIQLISWYGHEELGIPPRIDLRAHLLHAARGEPALHSLKHFYRDHFFHAIEVCLLGHIILETKLGDDRYFWEKIADLLNIPNDPTNPTNLSAPQRKNKVLSLWYFAALLHDIGYTFDVLNSSRDYLTFFQHSELIKDVDQKIKQAIPKFLQEDEVVKFGLDKKTKVEFDDHGIVGAMHLYSLLARISEDDKNLDIKSFIPAIQAIALHNLRRPENKVAYLEHPLAFLLIICDQLQEWRRPRLPFATSPSWFLSKLGGDPNQQFDMDGAYKAITTNIQVATNKSREYELRVNKNIDNMSDLSFSLEFNNLINKNSGVFYTWLDSTLNFQRLNFDGSPIDVNISIKTPPFNRYDDETHQSQLYRLRNAAHETHMAFLAKWFPTKKITNGKKEGLTNGAVSHYYDTQEELILNLRVLSQKALMTRGMDAFRECLEQWKHYNDDRDFPGDYVSVTPE